MTPDQVDAVTRTFSKVAPHARQAGLAFYEKLFAIDPSTRPLFPADIEEQSRKLMQVLAFAVSNLRAPETLIPAVRSLGERHNGYGVKDGHYGAVAQALLATLKGALGTDWTPQVEDAWVAAYTVLANEMKDAQHKAVA